MNDLSANPNGGSVGCHVQHLDEHREKFVCEQLHLQELKLTLCCHQQQLQQFVDHWIQQQEGILDEVIRDHVLERCSNIGNATLNHGDPVVFDDQMSVTSAKNDMIPDEYYSQFRDTHDLTAKEDGCVCTLQNSAAKLRELATSGMNVHRPLIDISEHRQNSFDTFPVVETHSNLPEVIGKFESENASGSQPLERSSRSMHSILGFSSTSSKMRSAMIRKTVQSSRTRTLLREQGKGYHTKCSFLCLVTSAKFESMCAAVILANAAVMGIAADYDIEHLHEQNHVVLAHLELAFTIYYTVEVVLRVLAHGWRIHFFGSDWKWNCFDVALIFMAIFDRIQNALSTTGGSGGQNLSILRMLRLFKMLRLLRMIRLMKMFKELRLILYSMLGSISSMLWASLLVLLISYMVSICLLQGCTNYLQDAGTVGESQRMIKEYWSSMGQAILSLLMATTGGEDWIRLVEPLKKVGWAFSGLFIAYIAFFIIVVMNTVTSLFVDSTMENSLRDLHAMIQTELEKKDMYVQRLQTFFEEIDEDGDGVVTYAEFCAHSNDPVLHAFAASLDIDIDNSKLFFKILSNDGLKEVDVQTFVEGCIKLRGLARSMDLIDLVHTTKQKAMQHERDIQEILQHLENLRESLIVQPMIVQKRLTPNSMPKRISV